MRHSIAIVLTLIFSSPSHAARQHNSSCQEKVTSRAQEAANRDTTHCAEIKADQITHPGNHGFLWDVFVDCEDGTEKHVFMTEVVQPNYASSNGHGNNTGEPFCEILGENTIYKQK
jgi:hypothetical protein